ncbi:hypothetical protein CERZMDRAFT_102123 [Cercospora zeae-maydis SCOH1-5]|uniref:Uncharacterized protein n=1 Tax=Cercospora zeae-maydis SCOH1-5 TaxID=717836 RepID=A0A6A6F108_9PEZI|nr:hypothetical protein CERZMDRAFT_102123 [Cercospora zeae-maydis SCOH1-5]
MSVRRHSKCFADVAQHPDHPHSVTIVLETRDRQGNGRKNQSRDLHARHSESARPKRTKQLCCREAESVNLTILPEACRARQTQLMQANLPSKRQSNREISAADDLHGEVPVGYTDEHDILLGLEYAPAPNDLPSSQTRRISDTVSHLYRLALALRYPAGTEYLKSVEYRIFTAAQELEKHVVDHHNIRRIHRHPSDALYVNVSAHPSGIGSSIFTSIKQQLALFALPERLLVAATDDDSDSSDVKAEQVSALRSPRVEKSSTELGPSRSVDAKQGAPQHKLQARAQTRSTWSRTWPSPSPLSVPTPQRSVAPTTPNGSAQVVQG